MSKGISNLFHGTKGDKIARAIRPSEQRNSVTKWAEKKAAELSAVSKRQRDKFNTACVAVDESTGNMFFGRNGGIGRNGEGMHPSLSKAMPASSLNGYPTPWNCAEADAINKALHAGAHMSNIHIYTVNTKKSDFGSDKASCENCTAAFKGRIRRNNTGWAE